MLKHVKGRYVELYIPGFTQPINGKVVDLTPLTSVVEDIFGNKIYVPNTLLVNSVIKEHNPCITVRIILHTNNSNGLDSIFNEVKTALKNVDLGPFRFNESYITIRSLRSESLTVDIRLSALSLPVRNPDLLRILNQLSKALSNYEPVLEVT